MRHIVLLAAVVAGCSSSTKVFDGNKGPKCQPSAASEVNCSDGTDDDCDGYIDCLDPDCGGQSCGISGGVCTSGACLAQCSGDGCLPDLPPIQNVQVTVRGDNTIIEFEPFDGALDYRIYPKPDPTNVLIGADGQVVVKNAVYRCAGARPIQPREADVANNFDNSLTTTNADTTQGYARSEAEAVLGYVYLTPGTGRSPVYRVADPNGGGGFRNADWLSAIYSEANSADYVVGPAARDQAVAMGGRDDGIVFYAPDAGTLPVYRRAYQPQYWGQHIVRFYTDGPEADKRAGDDAITLDFGPRFNILTTQDAGTVALHRVNYLGVNTFDVLAAGDSRYAKALHQGNVALPVVSWPGIAAHTTFVIEALDAGCPFPNGYVSSAHADADTFNYPSLTMDEARLPSTEVYINGEFDPANKPKPIGRAYADVDPQPRPPMDFYEGFDPGATWEPFNITTGNNGMYVMRNSRWDADFSGCSGNLTFGPMLGQLVVGFADYGSSCNMSLSPRNLDSRLASDHYLHVRMSTDTPATDRRYPQIMITTTPLVDPNPNMILDEIPVHARLGPLPYEMKPPGDQESIIVQPFAGYEQLNVEFCDQRGWGVGNQCPQANIYGYHAADYTDDWGTETPKWTPVPVLGDLQGFDRPVKFDVYASTNRVYVFLDDKPAGCAVLPAGRMPAGPVTVAWRAVLYHSGIDEPSDPNSGQQYLHRYSLSYTHRHMDDFGVELSVPQPAWDESVLPCGTRWYGGS